jgi:hypothetical protein
VRDGVDDPIPTFPLAKIAKSVVPVEDATVNGLIFPALPVTASVENGVVLPTPSLVIVVVANVDVPVTPRVPPTPSRYPGVVDPIPTFPLASIVKSVLPVEEATVNGLRVEVPCTKSDADAVEVPTLTLLLYESAKRSGYVEVPTEREPYTEESP